MILTLILCLLTLGFAWDASTQRQKVHDLERRLAGKPVYADGTN